jgi:ankyrin repeat protein
MWASRRGYTATVELLLGAGADKESKDEVREGKNYTHARTHMDGKTV